MPNNLQNLSLAEREDIAFSPEVQGFCIVLYEFRTKMLDYVRSATPEDSTTIVKVAKRRANKATTQIEKVLKNLNINTNNTAPTANVAVSSAQAEFAIKCQLPQVYDPVTNTCV